VVRVECDRRARAVALHSEEWGGRLEGARSFLNGKGDDFLVNFSENVYRAAPRNRQRDFLCIQRHSLEDLIVKCGRKLSKSKMRTPEKGTMEKYTILCPSGCFLDIAQSLALNQVPQQLVHHSSVADEHF
jgi:hypothetical protein